MNETVRTRDAFIHGYLAACQNLVTAYDQPTMARGLMNESGISSDDFLRIQKESGHETRRMNKIIRELER